MLSGVVSTPVTSSLVTTTTPLVSVSCVAMPTLGGKLSSTSLGTDGVFVGLQSLPGTDTAAANGRLHSPIDEVFVA